jgi:hypothetical protein
MAAGLILAVMALFMAPMSVRELCTYFNRGDFVRDELRLEYFHPESGGDSAWLEGRIVSTGERYTTDRIDGVFLDRLQELSREGKLDGYRVPVWYLPKRGLWYAIDKINPFRVRSPEELAQGLPAGLIAVNVAIALACVFLIRRGAEFPRPPEAGPAK